MDPEVRNVIVAGKLAARSRNCPEEEAQELTFLKAVGDSSMVPGYVCITCNTPDLPHAFLLNNWCYHHTIGVSLAKRHAVVWPNISNFA